ncbi:DUF190 domain-containing protein [Streptomyces sp. NPDC048185]|uniref:DUF190 domain-containing protein n=1 Tax=Streptomyces sp. NPDC048185 TaxID=3365508 RepID=UPI0037119BAE
MTRLTGGAPHPTVLVGDNDTRHHPPLYPDVVHRAHRAGPAGACVFRGTAGPRASSLIPTTDPEGEKSL